MKKYCALIAVLCLLAALACAAGLSEGSDGLNMPAGLTKIEDEAFMGTTSAQKAVVPEGVTEIGARAFSDSGFREISLPATLTAIGEGAFRNCGNPSGTKRLYLLSGDIEVGANAFANCTARLTFEGVEPPYLTYTVADEGVTITGFVGAAEAVDIPATIDDKPVTAIANSVFKDRRELARVVIPATVTSIGSDAFRNCQALTQVDLPAALTSLGNGAFRSSGLTDVTIPSGLTAIGNSTFQDTKLTEVTIPGSVTSIGISAFQSVKTLTAVNMPEGLISIGESAFNDCYALATADIPSTVESIGYQAFRYCTSLTRATIPEGITELTKSAFVHCEGLVSVHLPETLTSVGDYAFDCCYSLKDINFPATLTSVGECGFGSTCRNQAGYPVYALPESLTTIGRNAFDRCCAALCVARDGALEAQLRELTYDVTLTYYDRLDYRYQYKKANDADTLYLTGYAGAGGNVAIPAGPAVIGDSVFEGNTAITAVSIPDGVTTIGRWVFQGCTNLASATIADSVVDIGDSAFKSCAALTDVQFPAGLQRIGSDAFDSACTAAGTHYYVLPDHVATLSWTPFSDCGAVLCFNRNSDTAALFQQDQYIYTYTGETDFRYRWYQNEDGSSEGHRERLMKYVGTGYAAVEIPPYVWLIDDGAFRDHTELTSIVIPEGVTRINADAFRDCANLTDVTFPDSLNKVYDSAFNGCGSSAQAAFCFQLPAGIRETGQHVFDNCPAILVCGLETATASTISNRGYSFVRKDREEEQDLRYKYGYFNNNQWVWALYDYVGGEASVTLPDDCANVISERLRQKVTSGLELKCSQMSDTAAGLSRAEINFTFPGHEGLRYRIIDSVLYIMGYEGTGSQIIIPAVQDYIDAGVDEQVRQYSFQNLTAVTRLVLPEGVTRINDDAFSGCVNLTDITLPSSLKVLEQKTFRYCGQNLEAPFRLTLPDNMTDMVSRNGGANSFEDFNGVLVCGKTSATAALLTDCNYVYTVPGEEDFRYRYERYTEGDETGRRLWLVGYEGSDAEVSIPSGIYGIKIFDANTTATNWPTFHGEAFRGNATVTKVVIPEGAVTIRDGSFANCFALTDITFPGTLKTLDQNVFNYCGRDAAETFYFILPDEMEDMTGRGGGAQTFSDCNAVLQTGKYSQTAKLLTDKNFTYTVAGERDFRYRYEKYIEDGEEIRQLWLVGYVGEGPEVDIPAGIYGIRRYQWDPPYGSFDPSFFGRKDLKKVVIPEGTEIIEDSAFSGCTLLTDITLPESLRVLKNHAFEATGTAADVRFIVVLPAGLEEMTTANGAGWASFNGSAATLVVQNAAIAHNMYEDWWQYYGSVEEAERRVNLIRKPNDQEGFRWNGCP